MSDGGGALPPSPPLWEFQPKVIEVGMTLVNGLGPAPTGVMKIVSRIVRATFLDPRVAREAALDQNGTGEAVLAILLTTVPGVALGWLAVGSVGAWMVTAMITSVLMSLVGVGIMVGLLSALSLSWLGVKLSPGQLLRALAYSQGANMLSFVPGVRTLLALWTTVAGLAAVREISGAETQKVAILMIVVAMVTVLLAMVIVPVVAGALAVF